MPTEETQAAQLANNMMADAVSLWALAQRATSYAAQWENIGAANLLNAFDTTALDSTGGLGTADATPNVAHPIDTRTAPGSELNRPISANGLATLLGILQNVATLAAGGAVAADGATVQILALCVGG